MGLPNLPNCTMVAVLLGLYVHVCVCVFIAEYNFHETKQSIMVSVITWYSDPVIILLPGDIATQSCPALLCGTACLALVKYFPL